jgi:cytoskeletal protein CcmA (bactofilin family)
MFEIGKKATDNGPTSMAGSHQAPIQRPPYAEPPVKRAAAAREPATIGPSIRIDGDVRGEEDLLIEGEVTGTVRLQGNNLVIGSQGRVKANVYAQSIDVEGHMDGDLCGSERVSIRNGARVTGNVTAPRVTIEDGAHFKGSVEMDVPQTADASVREQGSKAALNGGGAKPAAAAPARPTAEAQAAPVAG